HPLTAMFYTLSLHDALPICLQCAEGLLAAHSEHRHRELRLFEDFVVLRILGKGGELRKASPHSSRLSIGRREKVSGGFVGLAGRSEEHTSELQSRGHLVCRL